METNKERKSKKPSPAKSGKSVGNSRKSDAFAKEWIHHRAIRFSLLFIFVAIFSALLPFDAFRGLPPFEINEPWRHNDLVAPFDFALQKPPEQLQEELAKIRANTPLVFTKNSNAYLQTVQHIDSTFQQLQPMIKAYVSFRLNREFNRSTAAMRDSIEYVRFQANLDTNISENNLQLFLDYFAIQEIRRQQSSQSQGMSVVYGLTEKEHLNQHIAELFDNTIINQSKSSLERDVLTLRQPFSSTQRVVSVERVYDLPEALLKLGYKINRDPSISEVIESAILEIAEEAVIENYQYDAAATQATIDDASRRISGNQGAIAREQVIIRKGDIVDREAERVLRSLELAMSNNATLSELYIRYAGDVVIMLMLCFGYIMYFYLYAKWVLHDNRRILLVIVILSLLALLHRVIGSIDTLSIYLTPLAIAPIILTVFLNSRIGLVTAFFLPLMVSLISGPDSQFVMSATLAGIAATYNSRDLKDRLQFYAITPGLILLAYLLVHTGFTLSRFTDMRSWVEPLLYFGINAISILLIYPIVMLFERLFDMTTDFTLLELSDTNHPLLKELMNKAPGTFHHSLQVGNLSEAAANEIGANALLCRTAALYHDIGKMKRPYYFTENQSGQNEHDNIKPSMSAMIIKDHVTQGVQMAREHKLPQAIIDFIQTHHGTTLVSFFYKKAKETSENPDEIKEESFRYDGPLPFSKETGILMLADTVEAASRSLKDPTYTKLENLIDKLVDHKMDGKQLSRTPLTFKEIEKIKGVFLTILSGIYHSRVEYPEEQKAK